MDRKSGIKYIILPFIITTLVTSGVIYGIMTSTDTPNNILRKKKTTITIASPFQFPEETDFFRGDFGLYSWKDAISAGLYRMIDSIDRDYEPDLALDYPVVDLDRTTITINLKPGLVFSNGAPLTSHDILFSYQLALLGEVHPGDYRLYDSYLNY